MVILAIFAGCALLSYFFGFAVYRVLMRRNVIDRPNVRSSHSEPTVRGGGIAIIAVIVGGALVLVALFHDSALLVVTAASVMLSLVSFWDDLHPLPPAIRFGCHALCAIAAMIAIGGWSSRLEISSSLGVLVPGAVMALLSFFWIAGYTNAFNFMDGINGLAAGQATLTGAGAGLLVGLATGDWLQAPVLFAFVVAGAAAGFLPHNFPRARMFMGDVSSAPLGFLLALLALWLAKRNGPWVLIPLALLHTNFVLDTAITLGRRIVRRERWYESHREHFYQRLNRAGKSHSFVSLCEFALQLAALGLLVSYLWAGTAGRLSICLLILLMWSAFLFYCEKRFRTSASPG